MLCPLKDIFEGTLFTFCLMKVHPESTLLIFFSSSKVSREKSVTFYQMKGQPEGILLILCPPIGLLEGTIFRFIPW